VRPSFRRLQVIIENAYIAELPVKLHSPWATCFFLSTAEFLNAHYASYYVILCRSNSSLLRTLLQWTKDRKRLSTITASAVPAQAVRHLKSRSHQRC